MVGSVEQFFGIVSMVKTTFFSTIFLLFLKLLPKNKICCDLQIMNQHFVQCLAKQEGVELYTCAIDLTRAFDSVRI